MNSQKPERHGIDIIWQNQIDINCINSNIVENIHSQSYKLKKKWVTGYQMLWSDNDL